VGELNAFMAENRTFIIESIKNGTYQPQAVLGVEIDKASGGKRLLGIPMLLSYYFLLQFYVGMYLPEQIYG
ncbi:MAG TPA: hypothetical protein VE912_26030, partial [Bacteroidales bacterium]|nr:hypothetical protein [Bacteroidales bacterium]